jgi:hypothetical protein
MERRKQRFTGDIWSCSPPRREERIDRIEEVDWES